jgi:hypothetical protein
VIRRNPIVLAAAVLALAAPAAAQAEGLEIVPGSPKVTALNATGTVDTQAGSHPESFVVGFELKTDESGDTIGGEMRDVIVNLPPGFIGNPQAMPRCTHQQFEGALPHCSGSTQVGVLKANVSGLGETVSPVYNLTPPPGVAVQFGVEIFSWIPLQFSSVRSEDGYGLSVSAPNLPFELNAVTETIWGTPSDKSHDPERVCADVATGAIRGCSAQGQSPPFLTLPTSCGEAVTSINIDSKQDPGRYMEIQAPFRDAAGNPAPVSGCNGVPFSPKISSQPTTKLAENPSGLDFELKLPNQGLLGSGAISETQPKKTVVTLPEGVTVNPSLAEGISTCGQAQYAAEKIDTPAGAGCPETSKLGSVIAQSPLLEEPVEGSVYLAAPYENPFGTLTALYLVARAPERGILVKQAGRVDFDPASGQITTTFDNLPPIPYSSFKLHFREGARAPLATPQACGEYRTLAKMIPFSASSEAEAITREASFQIERGAEGGPCPAAGTPPFHPGLIAGSINNAAGRYSPFNVRMFRNDSEQEISHFSIKLPPGISGKLAGVPYCPEANIAAAKARENTSHGGQEELNSPSCPAASEVGHSLVGVGVGSALTYVPGKIYLAGPYHGSNLSILAITAAKVGPFDVGTVVVRQALRIDPESAEVSIDGATSDPIPHIIAGIPVHLRDIRAYVDRPDFVLNPTSCKPTSTASTLLGSGTNFATEADDQPVTVTTRYQAADCASLPFGPKLALSLKGGTKRGQTPALKAVLTAKKGEANTGAAQITLPHSEFLEQAHIGTVCTRVQFKEGKVPGEKCPPASVYGRAEAITPILGEPLKGPVYLRSSSHPLPDLVATLHNAQVDIALAGRIDSVQNGRIRNTFEAVPDAPVSKFTLEMKGGKKGLLVNSTDLCKRTNRALSHFTGQNGKVSDTNPVLVAQGCKGKAKKKKKAGAKPKAGKRAAKRLALRSAW